MAGAQPMECVYPTGMVERTIVLHSADNGKLMVGEAVALRLDMLRNKIINNPDDQPTLSISGTKFATVIDYCTHLAGLSTSENFRYQCNKQTHLVNLFNLVQAAHHLGNKSLMDLTCHILKYKIKCKTIETKKELNNPDACVQRVRVAKRLKRDSGEGKCIESLLKNPRRQSFIMVSDCEDVLYHRFVASELGCVNRKNPYIDGYIQNIIMSSKLKELEDATAHLGRVMAGDRSSAESLGPNVIQRLLDILRSDSDLFLKGRAMDVLSQASFDKCRKLMEDEVIPALVNSLSESVDEALMALNRLACAFPNCIEFIIENNALEAVGTIVDSDRGVDEYITYSAKFLAVICRNYNLPVEKEREALKISEAILLNPNHSFRNKARACYILSYLSHKNRVQIKQEISDMLIDFIYCGDTLLAGSALGVLENIVRWGTSCQVEYFVKDTKLLRCLAKRMLCCGRKKFQKQASQIISNIAARGIISIEDMIDLKLVKPLCSLLKHEESDVQMEAAWALFNGINEYTHEQIDEYLESGNCSESI
ncbi:hypothetical protein POM88_040683 [Heracleum sosnowskyi]|uniref:Uncharacterized protein n=1 Tax=Heracleum sosnowskyi TaxID=360622 RepID=A0AAD8HCL3_9APIA|nr:hypothetical protein POM88_040683 [Heracleum sosnowskyi]